MAISNFAIRNLKRAAVAVVGSVVALALSAHAQAETSGQKSAVEGRVIVTGDGSVTVTPSYAQIRSGVTTDAKTVKEAANANTKLMSAVMQALLNFGLAQKDIQTSQFSIQPVYTSQSKLNGSTESKLSGFRVSNQVRVTVRDISQVAEILDRLITAGATDVGNIVFLVSDSEKALDQARENALADARRKAELYARAAGVRLGRVAWITETSNYMPVDPTSIFAQRQEKPVPIEPGEQTLRANITVGFDIAQ